MANIPVDVCEFLGYLTLMHKIFIAQNLKAVLQYGTEKAKVCKYVQKMQREKLHWFFFNAIWWET